MALDIIKRLDVAQENRHLTQAKLRLRVIEQARKKQAVSVTNIKEVDSNTKFFHRKMNACKRKNRILWLCKHNGWAVTHAEESAVTEHFCQVMGRPEPWTYNLNWSSIGIASTEMPSLDDPFIEAEICKAINKMPSDKVLHLDDFTRKFFKSC